VFAVGSYCDLMKDIDQWLKRDKSAIERFVKLGTTPEIKLLAQALDTAMFALKVSRAQIASLQKRLNKIELHLGVKDQNPLGN